MGRSLKKLDTYKALNFDLRPQGLNIVRRSLGVDPRIILPEPEPEPVLISLVLYGRAAYTFIETAILPLTSASNKPKGKASPLKNLRYQIHNCIRRTFDEKENKPWEELLQLPQTVKPRPQIIAAIVFFCPLKCFYRPELPDCIKEVQKKSDSNPIISNLRKRFRFWIRYKVFEKARTAYGACTSIRCAILSRLKITQSRLLSSASLSGSLVSLRSA